MSDTRITDAMVDATAQRMFIDEWGEFADPDHPWLTTSEQSERPKFTRRARAALEAAALFAAPVVAPTVTWMELKDALRPLKAFEGQDEIAVGAAADAVLELLSRSAS